MYVKNIYIYIYKILEIYLKFCQLVYIDYLISENLLLMMLSTKSSSLSLNQSGKTVPVEFNFLTLSIDNPLNSSDLPNIPANPAKSHQFPPMPNKLRIVSKDSPNGMGNLAAKNLKF